MEKMEVTKLEEIHQRKRRLVELLDVATVVAVAKAYGLGFSPELSTEERKIIDDLAKMLIGEV